MSVFDYFRVHRPLSTYQVQVAVDNNHTGSTDGYVTINVRARSSRQAKNYVREHYSYNINRFSKLKK